MLRIVFPQGKEEGLPGSKLVMKEEPPGCFYLESLTAG